MTRPKKEVVMNEDAREHMLALLQEDEAIKKLLETTIQTVLEAEMEEALGADAGAERGKDVGRRGGVGGS
jgi:transposase-like protein